MIVSITCMNEKGKKIGQLLSKKLEMPCIFEEDFEESKLRMLEQERPCQSLIFMTSHIISMENEKKMVRIYLYDDASETYDQSQWSECATYDLCLNMKNMSPASCAETIRQFIAIYMMQSSRVKKVLN